MIPKQTLDISTLLNLLTQHQQAFDTLSHRLIEENKHTNLTRITEPTQIRIRHFLDSLAVLPVLDQLAANKSSLRIADVGSGAGFPVLPLAIVRPEWKFTSIEATGKKVNFQKKIVTELGLKNVTVISARAEELAHTKQFREKFDASLARAVADLGILTEVSLPLVKIGSLMLAYKGPDVEKEIAEAQKMIGILGGQTDTVWGYSLPGTEGQFNLISIAKIAATPMDYPRSYAIISKKAAN
jgi:16S rRNA (guanine527-N7)-methyltransferase